MNSKINAIILLVFLVLSLQTVFAVPFLPLQKAEFAVEVIYPNGGETLNGTETISFKWKQTKFGRVDKLAANIYYSETKGNFNHLIRAKLNLLDFANCNDYDRDPVTWQICHYSWDTKKAKDGEYYLDIELKDGSKRSWKDSSDGKFSIDNYVPYKPEPEFAVEVIKPNGEETLKDSEGISFKWKQTKIGRFNELVASIYYSETKQGFEHLIKSNIDLLYTGNCTDYDNNTFTWQTCNYTWNTTTAADGEYYLDVRVKDVSSGKTWKDSSDGKFSIDNYPPTTPPTVTAEPGFSDLIEIIPEYMEIYVEKNDSVAVAFSIENVSKEKQCVKVKAKDNGGNYVDVSIAGDDDFCLNPRSKTSKTMNITTRYAPLSTIYTAEFIVEVEANGTTRTGKAFVKIHAGVAGSIEIIPSTTIGTVCRGKSDDIFFTVKNNSLQLKRVELSATGEFMPVLKEKEIELDGKQSHRTEINLYAPTSTALGDYSVTVTAKTDDSFVKKGLDFKVEECGREETPVLFELKPPSGSTAVEKDEITLVQFSVRNRTDKVLKVHLHTISEIWSSVQESIELEGKEKKDLYVRVKPVFGDATGEQIIKIVAWANNNPSETREFKVNVLGQNHRTITLKENDLELEKGKQVIFVLTVKNDGDKEQHYKVKAAVSESGLSVSIGDEDFILEANKEKEVFVSVSASEDANAKSYSIKLLVEETELGVTEKEMNFTVKEKTVKLLKVDSFPYKITTKQGESKIINFSITNASNVDFENVEVKLEELPRGVSTSKAEFPLKEGKTKQLVQQLHVKSNTKAGLYKIKLVVSADNVVEEEKIWLYILEKTADVEEEKEQKTEEVGLQEAMMAGLAALGGNVGLGILLVIVIVILLIALFYYGSKGNGSRKKQPWVKKRGKRK